MFQAFGASTTADFVTTGAAAGSHQFTAKVRSHGTTTTFSSNTVTVALTAAVGAPCAAVSLDAPPAGLRSAIGAVVALHASATCPAGTSPEFAYQVRRPGDASWTAVTGYGPADATFIPAGSGSWEISALVRAVGSTEPFQAQSAPAAMTVSDSPMASDDSLTIAEDHSGTINVLANDSDPNGDALTATIASGPSAGTATIAGGVVTYTPHHNYNGSDALTYTASDGHGNAATATLHITITPVNDPPAAAHDLLTIAEDTAGTLDVTLNDSDVDGDALGVTMLSAPDHGTATRVGNLVTYTPAANYHGSDEFQYTVSDGHGGTSTASVFVTVTSVDDPPTAIDDALTVAEDTAGSVNVLANDGDPDGDVLTVIDVTQPLHGAVALTGGTATYTPDANYHGNDAFTYTVSDGLGGESTATVRVTVTSVNDAPSAAADAASTDQDTAVTIAVAGNDTDVDGDALTVTAVTAPAHGTVVITGAGSVTYTPATHYSGPDSFSYTISDPSGATSTAMVTVTVVRTNNPPVAVDDTAAVDEDTAATIDVLANDSDPDGNPLTITAVTAPSHGTAVVADAHHVTYTPAANYHGPDAFSYTVSDGQDTASATVTVAVASVDDPPIAGDDTATTDEDTAIAIAVLANDSDPEGDALSVIAVGAADHGTVVIDLAGTVSYTPAADYHGPDGFSYTISDGNGGTATATVAITVTSVNDAPIAVDDLALIDEDSSITVDVTANDRDADHDPLTITAIGLAAHGFASLADGQHITYTPAPNYHGSDAVSYTISDGNGGTASASLLIAVASVNDAPVAVDDAATLDEDSSVVVDVVGNDSDADGDALAITAITTAAHGSAAIAGAHTITYTPDANYHGPDAVGYTISDGNGGTATASLALTVTSVNDAPVAVADAATTDEDTATTIDLVGNDSDVDGDALTITAVTAPAHGSAAIADAHHVTYTPAANYHGPDAVSYTIDDGHGGTATASVALTVTSVNDAPVASGAAASTFNDTPVAVALVASDVDGDAVTFAITGAPAHGTLGALVGNTVTYTPAPGFTGSDSFAFTASDGSLSSAPAAALITVNPSVCGNGVREGREECDDGNAITGDGCEASCKLTCGAGTGADRATVDPASGHCFAAYDGATHSYQQAAAMCAGFGAHLASLTTADEDAAAFAAVHAGDAPWLGADDIAVEGAFHWTTGEPFGYSHFATGKPDDAGNADCVRYQSDGTWSDAACASTSGTLCEFELANGTPVLASGGSGTRGVAIADLNGDGFADLATTNPTSNTVGILLGNGAGGFVLAQTYSVTNPSAIAAGDFDGDGHVDLAVVNATASTLTLLRGGAAGFTAGAPLAIAAGATSVIAADLDGDGALDLAVGATNQVQLWHGTGVASFTLAGVASGVTPLALAAGDFDHDGVIDLAVTTSATVAVLRGTGGGGFAAATTIGTQGLSHGLVATDLDGDGNLDLAVVHDLGSVAVWFGGATGVFGAPIQIVVGGNLNLVAAGDFDGDGHVDLAAIASGMATVLHGAGSARSFAIGPSVATGGAGASAVIAGRLDADATDDLVIANPTSSTLGVLLGGAPSGLSGGKALPLALNATAAASVTADFNADGRLDLAVSDPGTAKIYIYLGTAGGGLAPAAPITLIAGANPTAMAVADFNADGKLDLAIVNTGFSSVGLARGNGDGTFAAPTNAGTAQSPRQIAVADFNGDGRPDIAVACALGNAVSVLINAGTGFGRVGDIAIASGPVALAAADFNGDAKQDLVVVAGDAAARILLGHNDTTFAPAVVIPLAAAASAVAVADLDGDGHLDLVVTRPSTGHVSFLPGAGSGSFGTAVDIAVGSDPAVVVARDLDGDGYLDLVVGGADVCVVHHDPAGGFGVSHIPAGGPVYALTVADLDADGHADITVASGGAYVVTLVSPR